MPKISVKHTPGYGQFYLQDPKHFDVMGLAQHTREAVERDRFRAIDGLIAIFVVSEFSEVTIEVELSDLAPPEEDGSQWDRVVDCSINVKSNRIVLASCPDGPEYGEFGGLDLKPGSYRCRIHYGGQTVLHADGGTGDFYRVLLWPAPFETARIRKG